MCDTFSSDLFLSNGLLDKNAPWNTVIGRWARLRVRIPVLGRWLILVTDPRIRFRHEWFSFASRRIKAQE